ncbi:16S rRNA (guanine(527)-N(7))-methyltransferase RsmG [Roseisalinus antarcticus]|uniref:Ribosomal RNA small subunit methyltransferase G n=1 Tax=Roseisalinus antarcticus TaxID=254357 RepID=A0A1Y5S6K1_9RHOB|nr:16S rRNA (guanine(527)-N(7))-methyltransferase RsmG [Roseisalinus antarcticus]SLN30922.1 Ribosomal RNA small subunit methyltransferase G [Roseisalinus antarcticus]
MPPLPGLDVSRETRAKLVKLETLVRKWTKRINLIAPASVADIWTRHILDSAQLFSIAPPHTHWADLGSGGGFPGLVIAILRQEKMPDAHMDLVESDQRKATFLRTATRELDLPVTTHTARIEELEPLNAPIVSARALASLPDLLSHACRHLSADGTALFLKGRNRAEEISAARRDWDFAMTETRSMTDPEAAVLRIERITRV